MADVSELLVAAPSSPVPSRDGTRARDPRRALQLVLATLWLLDGVLQFQPVFFTKVFGTQMIGRVARKNPSIIAHPITSAAQTIGHHAVVTNTAFALIQVLLALGIAWRPTLRPALAASVLWSLAVWWIGEGLGGVLNGGANPVNGAPGAVLIYAILAVLLWPSDRARAAPPFVAARDVGTPIAKAVWLVFWGALAFFALVGSNRSPEGLRDIVGGLASGEPGWLSTLDRHVASLLAHRGLTFSVVLTVLLALVAVGVYLPPRGACLAVVLAIGVSVVFWVIGQNFGKIFTGGATDPNSGPLLVVLGLAYWRRREVPGPASGSRAVLDPQGA